MQPIRQSTIAKVLFILFLVSVIVAMPALAADKAKTVRFDLITWDKETKLIEEPTREGVVTIELALPEGVEDQHYDLVFEAAGDALKEIRNDLKKDFLAAEKALQAPGLTEKGYEQIKQEINAKLKQACTEAQKAAEAAMAAEWKKIQKAISKYRSYQGRFAAKVAYGVAKIVKSFLELIGSAGTDVLAYVSVVQDMRDVYKAIRSFYQEPAAYKKNVLEAVGDLEKEIERKKKKYGDAWMEKSAKVKEQHSRVISKINNYEGKIGELRIMALDQTKKLKKTLDKPLPADKKERQKIEAGIDKMISGIIDLNVAVQNELKEIKGLKDKVKKLTGKEFLTWFGKLKRFFAGEVESEVKMKALESLVGAL